MDIKKVLFGNPFKKSPEAQVQVLENPSAEDILFGTPQIDKQAQAQQKALAEKIFDSRQEAAENLATELRKAYYKEIFYTIKIRCPNCRMEGTVRLVRGIVADEAECPRCEVDGLIVIGVGSEIESDIINNPRLDEDSEASISEQVHNAVEHAWSIGRIKRGSIFEG